MAHHPDEPVQPSSTLLVVASAGVFDKARIAQPNETGHTPLGSRIISTRADNTKERAAFVTGDMIGALVGLTGRQVRVYLAHRYHRDASGEHWAGYETLAAVARCSVSTVWRANDELVERGLLALTKRKGQTHLYEVPDPCHPPDQADPCHPGDSTLTAALMSNETEPLSKRPATPVTRLTHEQLNSKEQQQQRPLYDFVAKEFGADAAKKLDPHFDGYTLDDLRALAHRATNEATSNRTGWFVKAVVRRWDVKPRKKPNTGNSGVAGSTGAIERARAQRLETEPDPVALAAELESFQRRMTDNGQSPTETVATEETSGKDGHEP